eukprot:2685926-Prymnesium_polylepis.1
MASRGLWGAGAGKRSEGCSRVRVHLAAWKLQLKVAAHRGAVLLRSAWCTRRWFRARLTHASAVRQ